MKIFKKITPYLLITGLVILISTNTSHAVLNWLKITVVNGEGNRVSNAEVKLYNNKKDYKESKNPIEGTKKTNEDGVVSYRNLDADSTYYVEVEKGDLNNYMGGEKIKDINKFGVSKITIVIQ